MRRNQIEQICKGRNKIDKKKLGFLGSGSRTKEQAYVRKQDYVYVAFCPEKLKNT